LAGSAIAAKAHNPRIRVFGVEPELAGDWYQSLKAGQRIAILPPLTIADGLRTPMPGEVTFPIVRELAEGVLLVSEEEIKAALRFLLSRLKILTEPSGAVPAAALLHQKVPAGIRKAGIILSGGNIDFDVLSEICQAA
jgi:threonine dehydratase